MNESRDPLEAGEKLPLILLLEAGQEAAEHFREQSAPLKHDPIPLLAQAKGDEPTVPFVPGLQKIALCHHPVDKFGAGGRREGQLAAEFAQGHLPVRVDEDERLILAQGQGFFVRLRRP